MNNVSKDIIKNIISDLQTKDVQELYGILCDYISRDFEYNYTYDYTGTCACISNNQLISAYNTLRNLISEISYRVTAKERYIAQVIEKQICQINDIICNHPDTEKFVRGELLETECVIQLTLSLTTQCDLSLNLAAIWAVFIVKIGLRDFCDYKYR